MQILFTPFKLSLSLYRSSSLSIARTLLPFRWQHWTTKQTIDSTTWPWFLPFIALSSFNTAMVATATVAKKSSFVIYVYFGVYLLIDHQREQLTHSPIRLTVVDTQFDCFHGKPTHRQSWWIHRNICTYPLYMVLFVYLQKLKYTTKRRKRRNEWTNEITWNAHKREWSPLIKVVSLTRILSLFIYTYIFSRKKRHCWQCRF